MKKIRAMRVTTTGKKKEVQTRKKHKGGRNNQ
jgi:hypothetical protein